MNGKIIGGLLVLMLAAAVASSGCIGGGSKEKVLIVGTSADFPPFEYKDPQTGNITGFDIDLIKMVAKKAGYDKVEIKDMDFDSLIPALQTGKVDVVIAGMTITEKRKQVVDFSIPYWKADQAVVVRKDSDIAINSLDDLKGKVIGVEKGTTGAIYIKDHLGDQVTLKEYNSYVAALQALLNGQVDVLVIDSPVANMFTNKYDVKVVYTINTNEHYGIAVKKGNKELLDKINKALQDIMNSPEWNKLVEKYFGS
ncbi:basic amino acid ABC transporter substrate-binding protein [Thermococcus sp. AM4]|uniref:basic amino acid ABC transporter substrate-binding protein n=1 Tax=Thermococcus sp. (strain AM4) TaxID=246969 RepID=UPI00018712A7|nr:basic amino acid ABC transporter substrate-binding protein [Thermococcus sp. AM4]EEB73375.1 Glutamine ABC transporter, periplasmic glutamine-binding protein [Thermococcus sp. AM4]